MQLVILNLLHPHRRKGPQTDVQRDLCNRNPTFPNFVENFRREVQARRRRCYRSPHIRIHRLVAIPILRPVVAANVWRKRNMSKAFNTGKEVRNRGKADAPFSKTAAFRNLGLEFRWLALPAKVEFFADPNLAPRPHQAFPLIIVGTVRHLPDQ